MNAYLETICIKKQSHSYTYISKEARCEMIIQRIHITPLPSKEQRIIHKGNNCSSIIKSKTQLWDLLIRIKHIKRNIEGIDD